MYDAGKKRGTISGFYNPLDEDKGNGHQLLYPEYIADVFMKMVALFQNR